MIPKEALTVRPASAQITRMVICRFCFTQVLETDEKVRRGRAFSHKDCAEEQRRIQEYIAQ